MVPPVQSTLLAAAAVTAIVGQRVYQSIAPQDQTRVATAVSDRLGQMIGKTVNLRLHTDPDIIGGLVAQIGDQVIDGSVQTRLRRLRTRLRAS